jgi:hypothetical protein
MERLGEGGDVPTVGEQRAARHGDLDITDQGVGRGGSRRGGDGKRWRSLLLKRMDWRKKRYVSRTPSRASGRVARCSCLPSTPSSADCFFSFDRAAPVLSTATAAFLRAGPDQSTATLPRAPPRKLHRLIPSTQPASRPLGSTTSSASIPRAAPVSSTATLPRAPPHPHRRSPRAAPSTSSSASTTRRRPAPPPHSPSATGLTPPLPRHDVGCTPPRHRREDAAVGVT